MLVQLLLPVGLSAVALFIASFLSWMVLKLHFSDWVKIENEDEFIDKVRDMGLPAGSYGFPGFATPADTTNPEIHKKCEEGPSGILTVFPKVSMGRNLGLTFAYFLGVNFCLAYLASFALGPDAAKFEVFRFVATAGLITYVGAMLQHAIWFRCRITGHVIESIAYAAITGAIFAAMWPTPTVTP